MSSKEYLLNRYRGRCAYCGAKLHVATVTVDHVVPKCKGGIRSKKNTKPSCKFCNMTKGCLNITEFRRKLKEFADIDDERGRRVRNKYNILNGKIEFFYEKLGKIIREERMARRAVWLTIEQERACHKQYDVSSGAKFSER